MGFMEDQIDDYLNFGIADDENIPYSHETYMDENEYLDRYYSRTYSQKQYDDYINLFR